MTSPRLLIFDQLAAEHLWPHGRTPMAEHYDSDGDGRADRGAASPEPDDLDWSPAYSTWTPCEDRSHPGDPVDEDT